MSSSTVQKLAEFIAQEDKELYEICLRTIRSIMAKNPLSILPKESPLMKLSEIVDNEFMFRNKAYRVTNTQLPYIDDKEFPSGGFKIEVFCNRDKMWSYLDNVSEFRLLEYFKPSY